jgi:hypothetical protein
MMPGRVFHLRDRKPLHNSLLAVMTLSLSFQYLNQGLGLGWLPYQQQQHQPTPVLLLIWVLLISSVPVLVLHCSVSLGVTVGDQFVLNEFSSLTI